MIENSPKTDIKTKEEIEELKRLTIRLDNLDNSDRLPKDYENKKKSIEEQIHNIEVNLSKQNQKFKERLDLQKINYKNISSQLKPNQLYIDFAKREENYYLFTLDSQNHISFKQLDKNSSRDIDSNITEFLDINKKIAKDVANKELVKSLKSQTTKVLSNLYKLLITKNIDKSELIISPDGLLNFLPFEALFDGKNYLVENYNIKYISSGREFIRQSKRKENRRVSKVVIFANSDFELELPNDSTKGSELVQNSTLFDVKKLTKLDGGKKERLSSIFRDNLKPNK